MEFSQGLCIALLLLIGFRDVWRGSWYLQNLATHIHRIKWYYRYCHFFNVIFLNVATSLYFRWNSYSLVIPCNLILPEAGYSCMISYYSTSSTKIFHISFTAPSEAIRSMLNDSQHFPPPLSRDALRHSCFHTIIFTHGLAAGKSAAVIKRESECFSSWNNDPHTTTDLQAQLRLNFLHRHNLLELWSNGSKAVASNYLRSTELLFYYKSWKVSKWRYLRCFLFSKIYIIQLSWLSGLAYVRRVGGSIPARPIGSWSLCPWARYFTHLASCECVWLLYVCGGGQGRWHLKLVCPRAAVATIVNHHH